MEHSRQAEGWAHAREILAPGCQEKERRKNRVQARGRLFSASWPYELNGYFTLSCHRCLY